MSHVFLKTVRTLSIVFVLMAFNVACDNHHYPANLVTADSLSSVNPDSAVTFLATMAADTAQMSKRELMYYKLLCIKAADKAYVTQTSDKEVLKILDYYENGGDRHLLPQAYYYTASAYRDMNDAPQALEYFQKAIDAMSDDDDLRLKSYAYNQMGKLFMFQRLDEKAYEHFYRSYQIDSLRKDTFDMAMALRDMSMAYEDIAPQRSLMYLQKAKKLNDKANLHVGYRLDNRISVLYTDKEEYDSAWAYIQGALHNIPIMDSSAVYSLAARICINRRQLDSAKFYCEKLMLCGTVDAKEKATDILSQIYFEEGNKKLFSYYRNLYKTFADSVDKADAKQALANASSMYNYQLREKENAQLKIEKRNDFIVFLIIVIIGCFCVFFLIAAYARAKKRQKRLQFRIFFLDKKNKEFRDYSEFEIHKKKEEIAQLAQELKETSRGKKELEKQLENLKVNFSVAVENKQKERMSQMATRRNLLRSNAYLLVRNKVNNGEPIKKKEWEEIEQELNGLLGDFKLFLYQTYELSELEYHICLLLKLGFKNNDIGILISRESNSVSSSRKRLYKKITGKDGAAAELDKFVNSI